MLIYAGVNDILRNSKSRRFKYKVSRLEYKESIIISIWQLSYVLWNEALSYCTNCVPLNRCNHHYKRHTIFFFQEFASVPLSDSPVGIVAKFNSGSNTSGSPSDTSNSSILRLFSCDVQLVNISFYKKSLVLSCLIKKPSFEVASTILVVYTRFGITCRISMYQYRRARFTRSSIEWNS